FDSKLATLRTAAGDRFSQLELSAFAAFTITTRRRASTEELIAQRGWDGIDVETVWQMPTIYIGSPAQIGADLPAPRARCGLSSLAPAAGALPTRSAVIAARWGHRGRARFPGREHAGRVVPVGPPGRITSIVTRFR